MISSILYAQKEVFETVLAIAKREKKPKPVKTDPWEDLVVARTIYTFCDRIRRLDYNAGGVEDSVLFASFRLRHITN